MSKTTVVEVTSDGEYSLVGDPVFTREEALKLAHWLCGRLDVQLRVVVEVVGGVVSVSGDPDVLYQLVDFDNLKAGDSYDPEDWFYPDSIERFEEVGQKEAIAISDSNKARGIEQQ